MSFTQKKAELFQIKVVINSYYSMTANQTSELDKLVPSCILREYWSRYDELKSQIRTLEKRKRKLSGVLTKLICKK